ncbi:MAG TPA: hypothetical protein ENN84_08085, partial [Candidatus Marinimicrobia bacterium]|nr:hypothetical protein [Candidatus Neomarinimicrobiota bacterium]
MRNILLLIPVAMLILARLSFADTTATVIAPAENISQAESKAPRNNPLVSDITVTLESAKSEFQLTAFK